MNFNIDEYICQNKDGEVKNHSICREERQYAALLYSLLLKAKNNTEEYRDLISKIVDENVNSIEHVFFEATLMRDYFHKFREKTEYEEEQEETKAQKFNTHLLQFCYDSVTATDSPIAESINKISSDEKNKIRKLINSPDCFKGIDLSVNLGSRSKKISVDNIFRNICSEYPNKEKLLNEVLRIARYLMNVKPDLLVIYTSSDELYAKSIELKFHSQEKKYDYKYTQTYIQAKIMDFLFNRNNPVINDKEYCNQKIKLKKYEEQQEHPGVQLINLKDEKNIPIIDYLITNEYLSKNT